MKFHVTGTIEPISAVDVGENSFNDIPKTVYIDESRNYRKWPYKEHKKLDTSYSIGMSIIKINKLKFNKKFFFNFF